MNMYAITESDEEFLSSGDAWTPVISKSIATKSALLSVSLMKGSI